MLLLLSVKQHQHICLSQISNRFCEVSGIPAGRETPSLKLVCKAQFEKRLVSTAKQLQIWTIWMSLGTETTLMPSFIPVGLKDSLPLFQSGTGPWKERTPTALSLCETRRVLIRKGTHYCGSPQQRLIASRVSPQTWYLCPLAWLNLQSASWLAFSLHPLFLPEMQERDSHCHSLTLVLFCFAFFALLHHCF